MSVRNLLDPILDQGLLHTNFFEGRLLTAQDLRDQQEAHRERARRLGRAIGEGIIEGLEVVLENDGGDGSVPVVTVKKGLALNGEGEIIGLPKHDVQVALSRTISATPTTEADFYACAGPPTTHLPNGVGVYVLVMAPASGYKDQAPKSGLGDEGVVKGCGSRYVQEGVRFRLVELVTGSFIGSLGTALDAVEADLLGLSNPPEKTDYQRTSLLRNLIAHVCLGTERLLSASSDLNGITGRLPVPVAAGAIGELRKSGMLAACDVCLGLLYWTLAGIGFLDLWSARRLSEWSLGLGGAGLPGELADSQAAILQFQEHLTSLLADHPNPKTVRAYDYFRYLPPLGVLTYATPLGQASFDYLRFFEGLTFGRPVHLNGAAVPKLVRRSMRYPPIDLKARELIWTYLVRENAQAADTGGAGRSRFMLFVSGHVPFSGHARFDVGRWGYANYTSSSV